MCTRARMCVHVCVSVCVRVCVCVLANAGGRMSVCDQHVYILFVHVLNVCIFVCVCVQLICVL